MNRPMVPYIAHEAEIMRMEKHARRLWIALLIAIFILVVSNLLWVLYNRQKGFEGGAYVQENSTASVAGDNECEKDN